MATKELGYVEDYIEYRLIVCSCHNSLCNFIVIAKISVGILLNVNNIVEFSQYLTYSVAGNLWRSVCSNYYCCLL